MKQWIRRHPAGRVIKRGTSENGFYLCWEPLEFKSITREMVVCYADLDHTPCTYELSASHLNAQIIRIPRDLMPLVRQLVEHRKRQNETIASLPADFVTRRLTTVAPSGVCPASKPS